jgi:orotate phosphoribosyltransferase
MIAVDACQKAGANIVLIIAIVDRLEGAEEAFAKRGIPFRYLFGADEFLRRGNSGR